MSIISLISPTPILNSGPARTPVETRSRRSLDVMIEKNSLDPWPQHRQQNEAVCFRQDDSPTDQGSSRKCVEFIFSSLYSILHFLHRSPYLVVNRNCLETTRTLNCNECCLGCCGSKLRFRDEGTLVEDSRYFSVIVAVTRAPNQRDQHAQHEADHCPHSVVAGECVGRHVLRGVVGQEGDAHDNERRGSS